MITILIVIILPMNWATIMFDDFFVRAAFAGIGVALATAPLGCMVVWRRMAFFGDATAHASILGVALALSFSVSVFVGILGVSLCMALLVSGLSGRGYTMDTMLGVLAHVALALGLVAVSLLDGIRVDLMAYLFGDILAVGVNDLLLIWSGAGAVIFLMWWRWSALLLATVNTDVAYASGIDPPREKLILTVALALVVAVAIKVVGVLLIGAMLIIPAASARVFARTPETMVSIAAAVGVLSVLSGLQVSVNFDTPTGPTIVSMAGAFFAVLNLIKRLIHPD